MSVPDKEELKITDEDRKGLIDAWKRRQTEQKQRRVSGTKLPRERKEEKKQGRKEPLDKEQILKENEEVLKMYNEKWRNGQDISIIEVKDQKETIENVTKEIFKKEKEIGIEEDFPRIEEKEIDELLELIELQETHGEVLTQQPIKEQPMEIEEEMPDEQPMQEELSEFEQGLHYDYIIRNFITTSGMEKKTGYDIKWALIRFVFKPNWSLYIKTDTRLSQKEKVEQKAIDGRLQVVTSTKVLSTIDYSVKLFDGTVYKTTELQKDFEWYKEHQQNENIPVSTNQILKIYQYMNSENGKFRIELEKTFNEKQPQKEKQGQYSAYSAYANKKKEYYILKNIEDKTQEVENWLLGHNTLKGYFGEDEELLEQITTVLKQQEEKEKELEEVNKQLVEIIQYIGGDDLPKQKEDGTLYSTLEEYIKDFEFDLKEVISAATNLEENEKKESLELLKKYETLQREIKELNQQYERFKANPYAEGIEEFGSLSQLKQYYIDLITGRHGKKAWKKQQELTKLMKEVPVETDKENKVLIIKQEMPKFEVELVFGREYVGKDLQIHITIHAENEEQHEQLKELFKKELVAIIIKTSEYSSTDTLAKKRKDEIEEWKKGQKKEDQDFKEIYPTN